MTIRCRRRVQLLALFASVLAPPLAAQMAAPDAAIAELAPMVTPPIAAAAGPTMASATLGYNSATEASTEMTWDKQQRAKNSSGPVLAIVGGAAFIGGLLIGGDAGTAIAVGGLITGLIGLYFWLK